MLDYLADPNLFETGEFKRVSRLPAGAHRRGVARGGIIAGATHASPLHMNLCATALHRSDWPKASSDKTGPPQRLSSYRYKPQKTESERSAR